MSRASRLLVFATIAVAVSAASTAAAQAAPAATPELRVVTISSFHVPLGADRQKVMNHMEKWMVAPARINPHVLSYRILQHFYGSDASDVAIVAEYANWDAINAPCQECADWFETNIPKEGTPERKAFDEGTTLFLKYYGNHSDQVYSANMALAKP